MAAPYHYEATGSKAISHQKAPLKAVEEAIKVV